MKLLTSIALSAILLLGCGVPVSKRGTYNTGNCSPNEFLGTSIQIQSKAIVVSYFSPKRNRVVKVPEPMVYSLISVTKGLYVFQTANEPSVWMLKLQFRGNRVAGWLYRNGEPTAVVFGERSSEKNLAEDSIAYFELCVDIQSLSGGPDKFIQDFLNGGPRLNGTQQ